MIKNIVFDWSGTLCDDVGASHQLTNQTLVHFGAEPISLQRYQQEFCIPVEHFYHRYIDQSITREQIDDVYMQAYERCFYPDSDSSVNLFDGVKPLLEQQVTRGFKLAILSTVNTNILQRAVESFDLPITTDAIFGGAGNKHQWMPQLLEHCQFSADETLFVGDAAHDIEVGQAINMITGAACYGYSGANQLSELAPDYLFDSIQSMSQQLDKDYLLNQQPIVLSTVGGIVQAQDSKRLLLVQTRKWRNKWGTPGGKIDFGETMQQAFYREVKEETGLTIDNAQWILTQEAIQHPEFIYPQHFIMFNYYATIQNEGELRANYESQHIGWFTLDEALSMDLNQPTRLLIERLRERVLLN